MLVGGGAWRNLNVTTETVDFSVAQLVALGMLAKLRDTVVRY